GRFFLPRRRGVFLCFGSSLLPPAGPACGDGPDRLTSQSHRTALPRSWGPVLCWLQFLDDFLANPLHLTFRPVASLHRHPVHQAEPLGTPGRSTVSLRFLLVSLATLALVVSSAPAQETHQATGVKVGEVTDTSAVVWMRVTAKAARNADGVLRKGPIVLTPPKDADPNNFEGACPGAAGQVRLRYGTREDLTEAKETAWVEVGAATDFTHQFRLTGLKAGTTYHYAAETAGPGGSPRHAPLRGRFETAPAADVFADLTF